METSITLSYIIWDSLLSLNCNYLYDYNNFQLIILLKITLIYLIIVMDTSCEFSHSLCVKKKLRLMEFKTIIKIYQCVSVC